MSSEEDKPSGSATTESNSVTVRRRQARPVPPASTCGRRPPVLVDRRRVVADPRGRRGRHGLDRPQSVAADAGIDGVFYVACGLSVTAGYHRLFAHRTYRAAAAVRWVLLAFGAATFQNSALSWSADHRAHHADTDGPGDPHPVTSGAWFAHIGWLFRRRQASADVTRLSDLWAVRSIRLQHRCYPVVAVGVGLVLPAIIAAQWGDPWGGLLVAGFLRAAVMLQATFCVNSLAHLVGSRRYDARSSARDSVLTALVTFGEGYHSFHHRFPFDYRNGPRWWHYDPSKWLIWTLARWDWSTVANRLGRHHRQGRRVGTRPLEMSGLLDGACGSLAASARRSG